MTQPGGGGRRTDTLRLGVVGLGWFGNVLTANPRTSRLADVVACRARSERARPGGRGRAHRDPPLHTRRDGGAKRGGREARVRREAARAHHGRREASHRPDLPTWRRDPLEAPFDRMTALGVHTVDTFHYYRLSLAEEEEEKALGSTLAPAPGKRPTATFGGGSPPVPFRSPPSAWIVAASNGGGNRCDASMSQLRWKEGS